MTDIFYVCKKKLSRRYNFRKMKLSKRYLKEEEKKTRAKLDSNP